MRHDPSGYLSSALARNLCFGLLAITATFTAGVIGCNSKPSAPPTATATAKPAAPAAKESSSLVPTEASPATAPNNTGGLALPLNFAKHTGDLDDMMKRRAIRALVLINPIGFFYKNGLPKGANYEALEEFEKFVNQKFKTGTLKTKVVFIPMRPDQLEPALTEGIGDIIASAVVITPEREQKALFSSPIMKNVTQVVVTGPALPNVSSFDDLAGNDIYVNPLYISYDGLNKINAERQKAGKQPINVEAADKNLSDDDLIEMVNAGLIPATITTRTRADLWSQVMPDIKGHPDMIVAGEGQAGWVMRKNNPQLKAVLDEFIQTHGGGTSFGNTLIRRYLQNTKWIKNSTNTDEIKKFNSNLAFFKQYATEYNFDYLMLAAQGYQESLLDQNKKNPSGAVGIMQVIPKYAAAKPIGVTNVNVAEGNIYAGAKMLRNMADTYFNDPGIDQLNKTLMTFASYNAGPNRIARLRKKATADGLDPNIWFGNVELEVAKDIGQETVTYVSNIYKYYIAYKLTVEQNQEKQAALAAAKGN
jgi:membrane-bound lytic murein transglycosylase MltF